jgi:sporulation protein YlmC with PRC-barrel domain
VAVEETEAVETPELETTEPLATETPAADAEATPAGDADQGVVIPPTGAVQANQVSNLLDFEVWNRNNEQIADVEAFVIDMNSSQVRYVVIGTGGFLAMGERLIPVPFEALELPAAGAMMGEGADTQTDAQETQAELPYNAFVLDASVENLEQAPAIDSLDLIYDQDQTAAEGDPEGQAEGETQELDSQPLSEREQEIRTYWETQVGATGTTTGDQQTGDQMAEAGGQELVLARDLLGATLRSDSAMDATQGMTNEASDPAGDQATTDDQDVTEDQDEPGDQDVTDDQDTTDDQTAMTGEQAEGQDLGRVEEIFFDYTTGRVRYALVSLNRDAFGETGQGDVAGDDVATEVQTDIAEADMPGDDLVPVPLSQLDWSAEEEVLVYTGSQSLLDAPAIGRQEFEIGQDTGWESEADTFWGEDSGLENNQSGS